MAHELDMQENGQARMAYVRDVPWHGLGQRFENLMTAAEVLEGTNSDFTVEKLPITIHFDAGMSSDGVTPLKSYREVPNRFATVRMDTKDPLGIVSDQYQVLQNRDAFKFFDPIVDRGEGIYDTAGVLRGGTKVWLSAKLPDTVQLDGDSPIERYLLFTNSHDGTEAVRVMFTPVRVVCQNTLNIAFMSGSREIRIRHDSSMEENLAVAASVMGMYKEAMDVSKPVYQAMMQKDLTSYASFQQYIRSIWPEPVPSEDGGKVSVRTRNNFERRESDLRTAWHGELGYNLNSGGTVWSAYQAVTSFIDHTATTRWHNAHRRMDSALFGTYASKRREAFNSALDLVGITEDTVAGLVN